MFTRLPSCMYHKKLHLISLRITCERAWMNKLWAAFCLVWWEMLTPPPLSLSLSLFLSTETFLSCASLGCIHRCNTTAQQPFCCSQRMCGWLQWPVQYRLLCKLSLIVSSYTHTAPRCCVCWYMCVCVYVHMCVHASMCAHIIRRIRHANL